MLTLSVCRWRGRVGVGTPNRIAFAQVECAKTFALTINSAAAVVPTMLLQVVRGDGGDVYYDGDVAAAAAVAFAVYTIIVVVAVVLVLLLLHVVHGDGDVFSDGAVAAAAAAEVHDGVGAAVVVCL